MPSSGFCFTIFSLTNKAVKIKRQAPGADEKYFFRRILQRHNFFNFYKKAYGSKEKYRNKKNFPVKSG